MGTSPNAESATKMDQKLQQDFSGTIGIDEMAGDLCGGHCGFTGGFDYLGCCEVFCNLAKE